MPWGLLVLSPFAAARCTGLSLGGCGCIYIYIYWPEFGTELRTPPWNNSRGCMGRPMVYLGFQEGPPPPRKKDNCGEGVRQKAKTRWVSQEEPPLFKEKIRGEDFGGIRWTPIHRQVASRTLGFRRPSLITTSGGTPRTSGTPGELFL